jgi:hypothetical protein
MQWNCGDFMLQWPHVRRPQPIQKGLGPAKRQEHRQQLCLRGPKLENCKEISLQCLAGKLFGSYCAQ